MDLGSLKTRLLALALLLVMPVFLLMLAGIYESQGEGKELARERATTKAKLAAAHQSHIVRQTRQQLATMTQFPLVLMQDPALMEKGLRSLKRLQPDYDDFGIVETNGIVFSHTLGSNLTLTFSRELLEKVTKARDFAAAYSGTNLQFAFPVFNTNNQIIRVMYASIKGSLFAEALTNISLPDGGTVTVFDMEGTVLARRPAIEAWVGKRFRQEQFVKESFERKEGSFDAVGLDGVERVYAVSTVSDHNWPFLAVTVGLPRSEIFAAANREFVHNIFTLAIILAILLSAAWWYSNRVFVRPAHAIMQAADRISEGDLQARTGLPPGKTELRRLGERFDQMAANLQRRQADLEKASEQVKAANTQLEKRVEERTAELKTLNAELEAFSYSVSHDLRAPLRHMDGFAQMLLKNPSVKDDAKAQRHLGVITGAAKQMGTLIDDLLSFSRMGRQALSVAPVDFDPMVKQIVAETTARESARKIEWKIESLPTVHGDAALLKQVWVNLISNAVKYSRERNPAVVTISSRATDGETIFSVQDNGAGFEMAYADKLFGVFQRLHTAAEFEGTGIGLANVRRIITRHGGRTWAEGKLQEGATFYFSLPTR